MVMINKKALLPVPTPNVEKKLTLILIFTLLYGASKGFMTVFKIIELENVKEPTQYELTIIFMFATKKAERWPNQLVFQVYINPNNTCLKHFY